MEIVFIAGGYPSGARPYEAAFVQQFVWAMARAGERCTVIRPTSIFERRFGPLPPRVTTEDAGGGEPVVVLRPRYVSFSSRSLGFAHTGRWTQRTFNRVVRRSVETLERRPDLIYGHFLYEAGYAALAAARGLRCSAVVGVGEDHLWTIEAVGQRRAKKDYSEGCSFLANSTPNKERLVQDLGISTARILVEPNGVDLRCMYPRDRDAMRERFGIDRDAFVAAFVGTNEVRKGPERVVAAVEGLPGVRCLLVGSGTERIESSCLVRKGPAPHEVVPELLGSADIFVLPTVSEGSCNAVIEAMACGLPVVTSVGSHMDDLVDDEVAVRVDPMDIAAIREAIGSLARDSIRRRTMSAACVARARKFDIDARASRVVRWMETKVGVSSP